MILIKNTKIIISNIDNKGNKNDNNVSEKYEKKETIKNKEKGECRKNKEDELNNSKDNSKPDNHKNE